jgi:lysozyme
VTLRERLIQDEGMRLEAYQDTLGLWTIGIGHLLGAEKRMSKITFAECMALFETDLKDAWEIAYKLCPKMLMTEREDQRNNVIVNMAFNLGTKLGGFKKFIAACEGSDWPTAAKEMMDSKWATQVPLRAERLRDVILKGH